VEESCASIFSLGTALLPKILMSLSLLLRNKFYIQPIPSPCLYMWHSTCLNTETWWGFSFWSSLMTFPPTFIHPQRWIFTLCDISNRFKAWFWAKPFPRTSWSFLKFIIV
jgi:hypothetical protein